MKLVQKNILIVGASQGIGEAMALQLAKGNNKIAIVSRRLDVLKQVAAKIEQAGSTALAIEADALDAARAEEVVAEVLKAFGKIDLAILVVGGAPPVLTYQAKVDTTHKIMNLNYDSMVNYFRPVVAAMRAAGGGQIAHVNSLAGLISLPILGPYSAAKAACRIFLDTARAELLSDNVRITVLCPGFIQTEGLGGVDPSPMPVMQPEHAAKKMVAAIEAEKRQFAFPFLMASSIRLCNALPYFILKSVHKKVLAMNKKALKGE